MSWAVVLSIIITNVFVANFILNKFLGLCPFLGVSKSTKPALGMGLAVIFVMTASALITYLLYRYILVPFHLEYLRTVSFILVIAVFVQLVELIIGKFSPALYRALGIYLPLITTNCAVMGVCILNGQQFFKDGASVPFGLSLTLLQGLFAGVGFTLALLLMSGIRERLDLAKVPEAFKGLPIAFIVASLMSMAFMGFSGFRF